MNFWNSELNINTMWSLRFSPCYYNSGIFFMMAVYLFQHGASDILSKCSPEASKAHRNQYSRHQLWLLYMYGSVTCCLSFWFNSWFIIYHAWCVISVNFYGWTRTWMNRSLDYILISVYGISSILYIKHSVIQAWAKPGIWQGVGALSTAKK